MTWSVLVSAPYFLPAIEEFRARLEDAAVELIPVPVCERLTEADLLALVADIDGVICGDDQFTEKVLRAASRLKVISKWGTGIDSIDMIAAAKYGIRVCNTPDAFTDAVADSTLGYILTFARKLFEMNRDIRNGVWSKPNLLALHECTVGVIGVGNIGKAVIRRAVAFKTTILANDVAPIDPSFAEETGITKTSREQVLRESDFVTLHCDLNPTSLHLIGRQELRNMKSSACLINTARGAIVDENALIEALRQRQIAGVALDVFEAEPLPQDSPLREFDNCLLAPHNANSSSDARRRVHENTIENLLRALRDTL